MKKVVLFIIVLFTALQSNAQNELIEKVAQQAVEIDSLKRELKQTNNLSAEIVQLKDSLQNLENHLSQLEEQLLKKESISDSLRLLKEEYYQVRQRNKQEYENGKQFILNKLILMYEKPFDALINTSLLSFMQRDIHLIGKNEKFELVLEDLDNYFRAKTLLSQKYESSHVDNAIQQLKQIEQQSEQLTILKEQLDNYQIYNDGLKELIAKINDIDSQETVEGLSDTIQKTKQNKILSEVSDYLFGYDFNPAEYPYLSDILFEILKRKQPNPDANISDLLNQL